MDQSVTIDGRRVLLNGEPVAEALGDFSVRVLAAALQLWGKAHKGFEPSMVQHPPAPPISVFQTVPASVMVQHQIPENVWRAMDAAALAGAVHDEVVIPASDYEKIAAHLASVARTAEKPAPADLLVKAREYYPNDEGLLRLYAEMRGYSCQQVEEAIDHAKRL